MECDSHTNWRCTQSMSFSHSISSPDNDLAIMVFVATCKRFGLSYTVPYRTVPCRIVYGTMQASVNVVQVTAIMHCTTMNPICSSFLCSIPTKCAHRSSILVTEGEVGSEEGSKMGQKLNKTPVSADRGDLDGAEEEKLQLAKRGFGRKKTETRHKNRLRMAYPLHIVSVG